MSNISQTSGVTTIRAFGWQDKFATENIQALDMSQKPYYLLLCLQCWLKVVLDCIMAIIAIGLIALTVMYRNSTGADVGMALNMMIGANTTLLRLVQNWTSLETSLSAVARLRDVQEHVPSGDGTRGAIEPGPKWPSAGELRTENITVSYSQEPEPALRNVSFRVNPGQKLIVMGRTGRYDQSFQAFHARAHLLAIAVKAHLCSPCFDSSRPSMDPFPSTTSTSHMCLYRSFDNAASSPYHKMASTSPPRASASIWTRIINAQVIKLYKH